LADSVAGGNCSYSGGSEGAGEVAVWQSRLPYGEETVNVWAVEHENWVEGGIFVLGVVSILS